jgi:hypothetical protein
MGYWLDSRLGPHYAFAGSFQPVANASVVDQPSVVVAELEALMRVSMH